MLTPEQLAEIEKRGARQGFGYGDGFALIAHIRELEKVVEAARATTAAPPHDAYRQRMALGEALKALDRARD